MRAAGDRRKAGEGRRRSRVRGMFLVYSAEGTWSKRALSVTTHRRNATDPRDTAELVMFLIRVCSPTHERNASNNRIGGLLTLQIGELKQAIYPLDYGVI